MAATPPNKTIKVVEIAHPDGTVTREDFAQWDFAHAPSDDPRTWYLPMRSYAEDTTPDQDCLLHACDAIKRAEFSPQQTRLDRREIPAAKARLRAAWVELFTNLNDAPSVLRDGIEIAGTEPAESE